MKAASNAFYRVGYSATPMKSGDPETYLNVTGLTGPTLSYLTPDDGIEAGRLVPADIFVVETPGPAPDEIDAYFMRDGRKIPHYSYARAVRTGIVEHDERNAAIAKIAAAFAKHGPTIILAERLQHVENLRWALRDQGLEEVRVGVLTGRDSGERRDRVLRRFSERRIDLLIASEILAEGVDVPKIAYLVLAGGGLAEHRQLQRIGRGMRTAPGKARLMVVDFLDDGHHLGRHSRARLASYQGEDYLSVRVLSLSEFFDSWMTIPVRSSSDNHH
jgi:superfamily II DNA or RNA helicase